MSIKGKWATVDSYSPISYLWGDTLGPSQCTLKSQITKMYGDKDV